MQHRAGRGGVTFGIVQGVRAAVQQRMHIGRLIDSDPGRGQAWVKEGNAESSDGEPPAFERASESNNEILLILPRQFFQSTYSTRGHEREAGTKAATRAYAEMSVEQDEMKGLLERTIVIGHEQIAGKSVELVEDFNAGHTHRGHLPV